MQGKIALEEHFAIPETAGDFMGYFPDPRAAGSRGLAMPTSTAGGSP